MKKIPAFAGKTKNVLNRTALGEGHDLLGTNQTQLIRGKVSP